MWNFLCLTHPEGPDLNFFRDVNDTTIKNNWALNSYKEFSQIFKFRPRPSIHTLTLIESIALEMESEILTEIKD